ncbi:MAG: bifunctional serine/threonine-protein kinase/formylglycine-generating enzyme family protein, partial [Phycisphaerae bacterium]
KEACQGDANLQQEVESLLAVETQAEHFLELPSHVGILPLDPAHQPDTRVGTRIGRFEITGILGRGGAGVVYRAVQERPRRDVALKVVRSVGQHDRFNERLLKREVHSLALMRHPGIAAIHEAGTADDGHDFFAMELVPGPPLTQYVRQQSLSVGARLHLFCEVCDAVQYAHQRGVIHRDLKPSNILVDAEGRPKIIDFGLAKVTGADAAITTLATDGTTVFGTLSYMSPEQAAGRVDDIDIRSDVYSLGVILFEMLTDALPYDVNSIPVHMALHVINHEPPPKLGALDSTLRGDLETIAQKTLSKEPERRYQSAAQLAGDVRRYLAGRPIDARRDSAVYVLRKYLRRHLRGLAIATVTACLLGATVAIAAIYRAAEMERGRREAVEFAVTQASQLIDEIRSARSTYYDIQKELRDYRFQRVAEYFTPDMDERMRSVEEEIASVREKRVANHYTVLELLRRAEQLGADPNRLKHMRGELLVQEYLDELNGGDQVKAELLRKRIAMNDPTGDLIAQLRQRRLLDLQTTPPGAEAYLFREVDQAVLTRGGEHRIVPVPVGDVALPVVPGTVCLRVERGAGPIRAGDVITSVAGFPIEGTLLVSQGAGDIPRFARLVSIDERPIRGPHALYHRRGDSQEWREGEPNCFAFEYGGNRLTACAESLEALGVTVTEPRSVAEDGDVPAEVWSDGSLTELVLPAGLDVRVTSRPLFLCPEARIGTTPIEGLKLDVGNYVFLFRKKGHETLVFAARQGSSGTRYPRGYAQVALNPAGTSPPGFRYVARSRLPHPPSGFWMKETEVTVDEYIEFLNDPTTQERITVSNAPTLFPRSRENAKEGGHLPRDASGRFVLPPSWDPRWPVFGVSWDDARAYAEWKTERARVAGLDHHYALPTLDDWVAACMPQSAVRKFVFGFQFHPKWMSSCYARLTPGLEPVLSFPRDESPFGVFDTSGSVSEWLDDWWLEDRGLRRHAGGSWADGGPEDRFGIHGGGGMRPSAVSDSVGFRLVLRMPARD